ncbi:MAG TPA: hypothetical protein VFO52_12350 [Longimicrobiales bacterium]|nr:hypothetical protein [Longimicrobiales bacterium]
MNTTREQKIIYFAIAGIIVAFLIGFLWQYTRARSFEHDFTSLRNELIFKRLESTLAAAVIEADRGNYEIARQLSSEFFTGLQQNLPSAPKTTLQELTAINRQRDAVITATSRSDPQVRSLLAQLYNTFRVAFGDAPVGVQPAAAPAPVDTAPTTTQ